MIHWQIIGQPSGVAEHFIFLKNTSKNTEVGDENKMASDPSLSEQAIPNRTGIVHRLRSIMILQDAHS